MELAKAILLAAAFLFWAANQFWPNLPQATLFNDIAIALFVLDVFLVIVGWPRTSPDSSFAETCSASCAECCAGAVQGRAISGGPRPSHWLIFRLTWWRRRECLRMRQGSVGASGVVLFRRDTLQHLAPRLHRGKVVVSPTIALVTTEFCFQAVANRFPTNIFLQILRAALDARGLAAAILKFRASPPTV